MKGQKNVSDKKSIKSNNNPSLPLSQNIDIIGVTNGKDPRIDSLKVIDEKYMYDNYQTNNKFNDTLEKLIDTESDNSFQNKDENLLFNFKDNQNDPLFNLVDLYVTANIEFSTDNDWEQIIKKAKHQSKLILMSKILNLKERKWNKENILLSDIIKENRDNLDSYIIIKYLNMRIKMQEHFNWLIWALSYYYYSVLLSGQDNWNIIKSDIEEFGLPPVDSINWINGFEWKGVFIRVQAEFQSKNLFDEIKALNYLFFEYIQLIDTYKLKSELDNHHSLLSNELIFPMISYSKICGLIIFGSVSINKYNYDMVDNNDKVSILKQSEKDYIFLNNVTNINVGNNYNTLNNQESLNKGGNVINLHNMNQNLESPFVRYHPKLIANSNIDESRKYSCNRLTSPGLKGIYSSNKNNNVNVYSSVQLPTSKAATNTVIKQTLPFNLTQANNYENISERKYSTIRDNEITDKSMNYDLSQIMNENNSFHSVNVSNNINRDINLNSYSKEDLQESVLFSKLESKHLIKVIDDLNDYNNYFTNNNYATEANANINFSAGPKFKFMIVSAISLIPNLIDHDKKNSFIYMEESDKYHPIIFNSENMIFNKKLIEKFQVNSNQIEFNSNESHHKILRNIFKQSKSNVNNHEIISKNAEILNYEGLLNNINYKIFYIDNNKEKSEKNYRVSDYFVNIYAKQVNLGLTNSKLLNNLNYSKHLYLKLIVENKNLEIKGKTLILHRLASPIKLKYSLIKSNKNLKIENLYFGEDFVGKSNYLNLIEKFSKHLDCNLTISNLNSLKDNFHKFGVNTSLEIFLLPKLKNEKIADLIKINIFTKMIKRFLNFHEGINILLKLNLIHANNSVYNTKNNDNFAILNDAYFENIKGRGILNIQKEKIYMIIQTILKECYNSDSLSKNSNSSNEFVNYFYDNLNFVFYFKMLKWCIIDENVGFGLFSDSNTKFKQESLLKEFILTSRKRPFMFLNALEQHLNISIDPLIKFKSSIALEQFLFHFNSTYINEPEPVVTSFIKPTELSYYLFSKCIYTSKTSTKYDSYKNKFTINSGLNSDRKTYQQSFKNNVPNNQLHSKASKETKPATNSNFTNTINQAKIGIHKEKYQLVFPPNSLNPKVNLINHENNNKMYQIIDSHRSAAHDSIGKLNNNIKINSNNITKINMMNNRYVDSSGKDKERITQYPQIRSENDFSKSISIDSRKTGSTKKLQKVDDEELALQRAKICDNISKDMDLKFPPIMHKLLFKTEEKHSNSHKKGINKYLKFNYSFNKIDTIKDWKSNMEMLLSEVVTVDSSESVIIQPYLLLFIHYFFIEYDVSICKELIYKIKEILKILISYQFELLAVVNFLEGLIIEKKNYIECEEYYSKCLIFSLMLYGDPRGRGNFGNNFMLFPLWKIARQTCILENSLTNENFKEMFHCQDYIFKLLMDLSGNGPLLGNSSFQNHINNYYKENLDYVSNKKEINRKIRTSKQKIRNSVKIVNKKILTYNDKVSISDIVFDEDINEDQSICMDDLDGNYHISEKNFEFMSKYKYFPFPSISDVRTSYQTYFMSENFIAFLFKNMLNGTNSSFGYDEDYLNKLGLNCYSIMNGLESNARSHLQTGSSIKSSLSRKDKTAIFSPFMYDFLMDKLSYKKNPANYVLLAWGNNSHNETTHNNYDFLSLPRICYKLKDEQIEKLSCGWEHNVITTKTMKCFSWGINESGQCGIGEVPVVMNPFVVDSIKNVTQVSCGNEHSLALVVEGDVYSWGKSEDGVLGFIDKNIEFTPKKIPSLKNIIQISSGSIHNIALNNEGIIFSWGCSKGGQLGLSENFLTSIKDFPGYITIPTQIIGLNHTKVTKVSCGEAHSLALTYDGKVYGWGFTSNGQLGLGFCEDSFEPGQGMIKCRILDPTIINMHSTTIIDIQCGKTFSTFITEKHELLVCGVNDLNQLGIEQQTSIDHIYRKEDAYYNRCCDVVLPTQIDYFLNMKVRKIACGESHCLAIIEDLSNQMSSLWSWGSNRFGQLGQGSQIKKSMPKPINYMLGYTNSQVVEIACGAFHSLCVISDYFTQKFEQSKFGVDNSLELIINNHSTKWTID